MEKLDEFKSTINCLGNSYLDKLKDDNYSIKSKNFTIFGTKTNKWGKVFLKSTRFEIVIDLPRATYTEDYIADRMGLEKVLVNDKKTGIRIKQQEDRDQLFINIYKKDYQYISLKDDRVVEFLRENSKLVSR
ncbi:hypothetical protein CIB95_13025 [Lottiidibacillus patelloidae]|uniref:Uncharacterized protein n=1 Tax=Lottiidibacillus patelloidae TaxID=2670334 RepID=A0A263BRJ2_9BACI|nr:hypothetical protein [Lottiidibacillus patelloidae]OZM56331.1 hypothetical protein CIB95_13025 [Lottiidibacillus patelloidae]